MFIPKYLYIKDFMNHSESRIDFTLFNSCLVVGRNHKDDRESNGVGKSNIIKAIVYVLFNKYPTKKLEKIVRDGKEKCEVHFEFYVNNDLLKMVRKYSKKSNRSEAVLFRWMNNKWDRQDRRTPSATEEALQELIRINYDAFKNSIIFEQNSFSELAEGTDFGKRKILKEPLRLSVYSKLEKIAKAKYSEVEKEFDKIKDSIKSLGDPSTDILTLSKQLKILEENQVNIVNDRKNIKLEINNCQIAISDLEKLLDSDTLQISDKLVELDRQRKEYISLIKKYTEQIDNYNNELSNAKNAKEKILSNLSDLQNKTIELDKRKIRTETEVNDEITILQEKEDRGNKNIANLEVDYRKYSRKLPAGTQCELCFKELTDDYRAEISEKNKDKAVKIKKNLEISKAKMVKILDTKKALFQELKDVAQHNREVERIILNTQSKLEEIVKIESLEKTFIKMIDDTNFSIKNSQDNLNDIKQKEDILRNQITDLNVEEINNKIIEFKNNIKNKEILENKLIDELTKNSSDKGIVEERKNQREKDLDKLKELNNAYPEVEKRLRVNGWAVKAFSPSGIPTLIIHTILDDLQIEANSILQELRPEISLAFKIENDDKDALDIVYSINGKDREYVQLSGGQKMYVSFALKLGLSLVIQKRLGVDIRMLALDEVDQPLDDAGQDAYVDIIKKYQNKYKICVVTHNNRLKDKFSHAIFVEDNGVNGSSAKVVTQW